LPSGGKGQRFESSRARHFTSFHVASQDFRPPGSAWRRSATRNTSCRKRLPHPLGRAISLRSMSLLRISGHQAQPGGVRLRATPLLRPSLNISLRAVRSTPVPAPPQRLAKPLQSMRESRHAYLPKRKFRLRFTNDYDYSCPDSLNGSASVSTKDSTL